MSKFEIKINTKKIEKELNKKVNEIVQNKQKEMIVKIEKRAAKTGFTLVRYSFMVYYIFLF